MDKIINLKEKIRNKLENLAIDGKNISLIMVWIDLLEARVKLAEDILLMKKSK